MAAAARSVMILRNVKANCILLANLQQSIEIGYSGLTKAPVYDSEDQLRRVGTVDQHLQHVEETLLQTKSIIDSLQHKLHDTIYENAKLRAQLFDKVSDQVDTTKGTSMNTKFANQKVDKTNDLSNPVTSNSVPTPQESKNVIAPGMFRINPFKPFREEKYVPNKVRASVRTTPITVSQPHVVTKKINKRQNVSNTENQKKQKPKVKKPKKVGSNERLASPKPSKPRFCLRWSPTGRFFDTKGKIIISGESESQSDCSIGDNACTSNPSEPTIKKVASKAYDRNLVLINFVWKFLGTVRFGNDHVAAILGFGDLQWGNILITRVYFVEGLGHNLFSVGQFCDSDLEVAFRRNSCFVRNLDGVDLLQGNRSTNLYTINLHEMASASPICLMARASSTKSWLWHHRFSHLILTPCNEPLPKRPCLGLPNFKY
ncbi:hypothetical protein Tco_0084797 [Tanacetum coccineum]